MVLALFLVFGYLLYLVKAKTLSRPSVRAERSYQSTKSLVTVRKTHINLLQNNLKGLGSFFLTKLEVNSKGFQKKEWGGGGHDSRIVSSIPILLRVNLLASQTFLVLVLFGVSHVSFNTFYFLSN